MYDDRWSVVSWPEEYGGRGVGILEWLIFEEEYWRAEAPLRVSQNGVFLLAPTLFEFGTQAQKDRFLPSMASGSGDLVPGLVRARRRLRPGRHPQPGRALPGGRRLDAHRARRPGPHGVPSPSGASACSAPIPEPSATGA